MARDCTELKESMVFSLKFKCKAIEGQLDYMYVCVKGQKERPSVCKKISNLKMNSPLKKFASYLHKNIAKIIKWSHCTMYFSKAWLETAMLTNNTPSK